jgi:hypothetical protein
LEKIGLVVAVGSSAIPRKVDVRSSSWLENSGNYDLKSTFNEEFLGPIRPEDYAPMEFL